MADGANKSKKMTIAIAMLEYGLDEKCQPDRML